MAAPESSTAVSKSPMAFRSSAAAVALGWALGCSVFEPAAHGVRKIEIQGCENALRVSPNVISGGEPRGELAFRALADAGVKTIVSVDGAKPDSSTASRHGIRYVHLPIGYGGIPRSRALELARAFRDLPGPFYLHCHHGKHRGPAAAGVVLVAVEGWKNEEVLKFMESAGTSREYAGLYKDVGRFAVPTPAELDAASNEFPAAATVQGLTQAMAEIDRRFDAMKLSQGAGWTVPRGHPDIDPPHESLQLAELFTELGRSEEARTRPEFFRKMLAGSEADAKELRESILLRDVDKADAALGRLKTRCAACHNEYRNKPR
jgi:protein tyrosine phosphatase (PTP) superfamily phosphohydrolase (DUF442 family)